MQANLLPSPPHHPPFNTSSLLSIKKPFHLRPTTTFTMHATDGETKSTTTNITEKDDDKKQSQKPINTLNIRYRSKRRAAKEQQQQQMPVSKPKPPPKDWESMSLAEKAMELYVGLYLDKFSVVFGKDRANSEGAESPADAIQKSDKENTPDVIELDRSAEDLTYPRHVPHVVQDVEAQPVPDAEAGSSSKKKRRRRSSGEE